MILTVLAFYILIIGIILRIIFNKIGHKLNYKARNIIDLIAFVFTLFGSLSALIIILVLASTYIGYDLNYQNFLYERDMIEYRIEHIEDNVTGNEMLYNDIVKFNNELRSKKKWADNPWTNWFCNQNIASLDYIELDGE